jgi:hypothetical protein
MAGDSAAARGQGLSALKESLQQLDRESAVAWITGRLDAGTDAKTGSDLILEADHSLSGWTSLRVFLLDTLFAIDPAAARSPSLRVLDQPASPDEWALALRNLCLGPQAAEDLILVKARTAELVANRAWQEQPSSGYLEAFDFVVHTRHLECLPTLLDLCGRTSNPAVRHAAHLALDRLLQAEPRPVLDSLATASVPPPIRPMTANLVARADMRDPVQKARLESYLVDPQRTPEEIRVFTSVFPNANFSVSRNLVTPPVIDTNADRPERDAVALAAVEEWLRDPRFSRIHEPLAVTRQRLAGFVER